MKPTKFVRVLKKHSFVVMVVVLATSFLVANFTLVESASSPHLPPIDQNIILIAPESINARVQGSDDVITIDNIDTLERLHTWNKTGASFGAWQKNDAAFNLSSDFSSDYTTLDLISKKSKVNTKGFLGYYFSAFSSDGTLFTTMDDRSQRQVWKINNSKFLTLPLEITSEQSFPVFTLDNRAVVALDGRNLGMWSVSNGSQIHDFGVVMDEPDTKIVLEISPDGRMLAVGNHTTGLISLWDLKSYNLVKEFEWSQGVWSIAFSSDGKLLAAGSVKFGARDNLKVWKISDGSQIALPGMNKVQFESVAFGQADNLLMSGTRDGQLMAWDARGGQLLMEATVSTTPIRDLKFSHDGTMLMVVGKDTSLWGLDL